MVRVPVVVQVGPLADEQSAEMLVKILTGEYPLSAGAFYPWPLGERACKFFDGDDAPIRPACISKERHLRAREPRVLVGGEVEEDDLESAIGDEIVPSFRAHDSVESWYVKFADAWILAKFDVQGYPVRGFVESDRDAPPRPSE